MVHVKKEDTPEKHFPKGIYDYWQMYDSKRAEKTGIPKKLIDYFRKGWHEFQISKERFTQIEWLGKGIRRFINNAKMANYIPATQNSFAAILKQLPDVDAQKSVRQYFMKLMDINVSNKENWERAQLILIDLLNIFNATLNDNAKKFMKWVPNSNSDTEDKNETTIAILIRRF